MGIRRQEASAAACLLSIREMKTVCFGGTGVGAGWPPLAIDRVFVRQGKAVQAESSNPPGNCHRYGSVDVIPNSG